MLGLIIFLGTQFWALSQSVKNGSLGQWGKQEEAKEAFRGTGIIVSRLVVQAILVLLFCSLDFVEEFVSAKVKEWVKTIES